VEDIRKMKQQPGKDMYAVGGATLVSSLMDLGLIDELRLMINPVWSSPESTVKSQSLICLFSFYLQLFLIPSTLRLAFRASIISVVSAIVS
jgi:RibD C-terminal domain